MSDYAFDSKGNLSAKGVDGRMQQLNGLQLDAGALQKSIGVLNEYVAKQNALQVMGHVLPGYKVNNLFANGGGIKSLRTDDAGNLFALLNTPETKQSSIWGMSANRQPQQNQVSEQWVKVNGFQLDNNQTSKNTGTLPQDNSIYLRPEGDGYFAQVDTSQGIAAYSRQALQRAVAPVGDRLSTRAKPKPRGGTTMLGAPTSAAAGSKKADNIKKGSLLT